MVCRSTLCPKQNQLRLLRAFSSTGLKTSRVGGFFSVSLGSFPVSDHPHGEENFPNVYIEFSVLQLIPVASYSTIVHLWEEYASTFVLSTGKTTIRFLLGFVFVGLFFKKHSSSGLSSCIMWFSSLNILVAVRGPLAGSQPFLFYFSHFQLSFLCIPATPAHAWH